MTDPSPPLAPLSVLVLTLNEETNIAHSLKGLTGWADEIWVLDSFSTDRTLEIVRSYPSVKLRQRAFDDYASHVNWGLDNLLFSHEWILLLDADETLSEELKREIAQTLRAQGEGCDGFYVNRRVYFLGRWIKHCGWYPNWVLRLFRHRLGRHENRKVNQHLILNGKAGYLKGDLVHDDHRGLSAWITRHNQYSSWEAEERWAFLTQGKSSGFRATFWGGPIQRKRFLKEKVFFRLPCKPVLFFFYLYCIRLGFLDGWAGFHLCLLQSIQEYHIYLKSKELRQRRC